MRMGAISGGRDRGGEGRSGVFCCLRGASLPTPHIVGMRISWWLLLTWTSCVLSGLESLSRAGSLGIVPSSTGFDEPISITPDLLSVEDLSLNRARKSEDVIALYYFPPQQPFPAFFCSVAALLAEASITIPL